MSPLMFFLFISTVVVVVYLLGHRIGYLRGKAEVSDIPRGETPSDECLRKEFVACARKMN